MRIIYTRMLAAMLLLLSGLLPTATLAQFGAWNFVQPYTIYENAGTARTQYQARLIVDTEAQITLGRMQSNGADIRFATGCQDSLPYWIESAINTDTTVIWVKLDSLGANDSLNIFMFFGNSSAPAVSSFSDVFPNAIQLTTGNNLTLTGTQDVGWLEVNSGATLYIQPGDSLLINARVAIIDGDVNGDSAGYPATYPGPATGGGPGGGGTSTNGGSAGGSYAGVGGEGGRDSGDTPAFGGSSYGTNNLMDIDMGSSGGSSDNSYGGDGGGAFILISEWIDVSGTISVNGGSGQLPGSSRGGGGGAGGGVLLHGEYVSFSGNINANGGDGSDGTSTANDSGGGGGGGRIKTFYGNTLTNTGSTSVSGGIGGPYGSQVAGGNGTAGTVFDSLWAFDPVTFSAGSPGANNFPSSYPPADLAASDTVICSNDSITFTATSGFTSYDFFLNGSSVQSGAMNTWANNGFNNMDTVEVVAAQDLCIRTDELVILVAPPPAPMITASDSGVTCPGQLVTLDVGPGYVSYQWGHGPTTQAVNITSSGTYSVEIVDTNGCVGADSFTVVQSGPDPTIGMLLVIPCEGDSIELFTVLQYSSWLWSTGETTDTITVDSSGLYSVLVIDSNGCSGTDSGSVVFNPLPQPTISISGTDLTCNPAFTSYQWLLNGSPIPGATGQMYSATQTGTYSVTVSDSNGCMNTSDTSFVFVSIAELPDAALHVFPNPNRGDFRVTLDLPSITDVRLSVIDLRGREVHRFAEEDLQGKFTATVRLGDVPAGFYFLRLETNAGKATRKLIVE